MIVGTMVISLHAPWVHSLKEKRTIVKSICAKVGNKFNVSIAEVEAQDIHQTIVIGVACIANEVNQVDSVLDTIINFIETSTEAEVVVVDREII